MRVLEVGAASVGSQHLVPLGCEYVATDILPDPVIRPRAGAFPYEERVARSVASRPTASTCRSPRRRSTSRSAWPRSTMRSTWRRWWQMARSRHDGAGCALNEGGRRPRCGRLPDQAEEKIFGINEHVHTLYAYLWAFSRSGLVVRRVEAGGGATELAGRRIAVRLLGLPGLGRARRRSFSQTCHRVLGLSIYSVRDVPELLVSVCDPDLRPARSSAVLQEARARRDGQYMGTAKRRARSIPRRAAAAAARAASPREPLTAVDALSGYADLIRYREPLCGTSSAAISAGPVKGSGRVVAREPDHAGGDLRPRLLAALEVTSIDRYPLYLLCGVSVWLFVSSSLTGAARTMLDYRGADQEVRFPRQLVAFSIVRRSSSRVRRATRRADCGKRDRPGPNAQTPVLLSIPVAAGMVVLVAGWRSAGCCRERRLPRRGAPAYALLLPWFFPNADPLLARRPPGGLEDYDVVVDLLRWAIRSRRRCTRCAIRFSTARCRPRVIDHLVVAAVVSLGIGAPSSSGASTTASPSSFLAGLEHERGVVDPWLVRGARKLARPSTSGVARVDACSTGWAQQRVREARDRPRPAPLAECLTKAPRCRSRSATTA